MKKFNLLIAVAVLTALASCKKSKEDTPDPKNQAPEVSMTVKGASGKLWNEVMVAINASDADGEIVSVDLYANDQWVGKDNEAPYEVAWDTRDFDDGPVTLKAVVTDELEAVTESEKKVEVMNTLIDYNLHAGFMAMSPDYKYFTFITSSKGEVLYFDQIESLPYKFSVLRPSGVEDDRVDVHFVWANPQKGSLKTFSGMTPGAFAPVNADKRGKKIGTSSMKFADIPQHDHFSYSFYAGKLLKKENVYSTTLYENMDMAYLYFRQGEKGLYKIFDDLKSGADQASLSAMGFEMEEHEVSINQPLDLVAVNVFGHPASGVNAPGVRIFGTTASGAVAKYTALYHIPLKTTVFDHFSAQVIFQAKNKIYQMETYSELISKPMTLELNAALKGDKTLNKIDLSVSGSPYDFLTANYNLSNNGFQFSWECYSGGGDIDFPPIPSALTKAFPKLSNANLVFAPADVSVSISDYDHIKGYDNYITVMSGRNGKSLREGGKYSLITMQGL